MNLSEILMIIDKFGLVLKDTTIDYQEIYSDWDIPKGFRIILSDTMKTITLNGIFVKDSYNPLHISNPAAYQRKIVEISVRTGPLSIKKYGYDTILKAVKNGN